MGLNPDPDELDPISSLQMQNLDTWMMRIGKEFERLNARQSTVIATCMAILANEAARQCPPTMPLPQAKVKCTQMLHDLVDAFMKDIDLEPPEETEITLHPDTLVAGNG